MAFQGFLKQSTAVDILLGPFLDETNGKDAENALTLSQADIKLSKNGQALAQKSDVTAAAFDANGYYNCELDATDTNTVGQLTIICHESGALPVRLDYHVVEEAVYAAMYGGSAAGPLQSTTAGRKLDVAATGEAGVDLGNVTGTLTQANVGWVDANSRVDVGMWLGTAVTTSSTSTKPEVDVASISDDATAANNLELATENAAAGYIAADLTHIHGTALTETAGQLAGRFVNFFDQASATFNVATALASFKADVSNLDAAVSTRATPAQVATELATYDGPTKAEMDTAHGLLATVAKQDVIDGIVDAILVDTGTTVPATLATIAGYLDTEIAAIKAVTDALTAAAATQLALSAGTIVNGAAAAGTLSTTQMTTNLTEGTDDHYNGRVIIWTSGVLQNQATDITDYTGATKLLTFTAVTEAPSADDTFVIV